MKILCLAESGFGKSTSIGKIEKLGIEGLPPEETYIVSCTTKAPPFPGSLKQYPMVTNKKDLKSGKLFCSNDPAELIYVFEGLLNSPFKYIIWDDANYVMQDYYMKEALKKGWDTPKKIGYDFGRIWNAIEKLNEAGKHIFILAHYEEYKKDSLGTIGYRMKTTGNMVREYLTPEGKCEMVLFGDSSYDETGKKAIKRYVTNDDGKYTAAKTPYGMFDDIYIKNDLGVVGKAINEFFN